MKDKIISAFSSIQGFIAKAYGISPFAVGMAAGYFGKPFINAGIDIIRLIIKI